MEITIQAHDRIGHLLRSKKNNNFFYGAMFFWPDQESHYGTE